MQSRSLSGGCWIKSPHRAQLLELGKNPHHIADDEIFCKPFVQKPPKHNLYAKYVCWGDCPFMPASKSHSWDPNDT